MAGNLWPQAHSASQLPVIVVEHGPNRAAEQSKHYVILVSLDGFRYDYPAKFGAPNLERQTTSRARGAKECPRPYM
jgi:hypothetical protein